MTGMPDDALANKLAALARTVSDAALPASPDLGPSDVAALVALAARDGLTVGEIAAAAGLSPSATVRLVDRLERSWLVRRRRRVSREVIVDLTQRGRKRADTLREAGLAGVSRLISALDADDRSALDRIVGRVVDSLTDAPDGFDRARHCRYCVRERCDCGLHPEAADAGS
jgi:DNA-binding MarR family transcriptional regulator